MLRSESKKSIVPWLTILGLWTVLHGTLAIAATPSILHGFLPGPDEYMHLVRTATLRDGGGWYETVILRSNAPFGDTLHWTRPLDILILTAAAVFSLFMSGNDALFAAGAVISPVLGLLGSFAVVWAFRPLLGRDRAFLAAFLFLIQPCVLAYTATGRVDHHSLLFLWFVLSVGGTIRLFTAQPSAGTAAIAGGSYGLAIWTSVEMTLVVALCQAASVVFWIRFPQARARPHTIAAIVFVAVMALALIAEHPPDALLAVEFDRLSVPYAVIAALTFAVWGFAWTLENSRPAAVLWQRQRLVAIGIAGTAATAALFALFPGLVAGPYGEIDPRIQAIWHDHVAELQPLMPTTLDQAKQFLIFIGAAAVALPYAAIVGWRNRDAFRCAAWLFLAAVLATYFLLSLQHFRLAPFAEIASAPVLADMAARLIEWSRRTPRAARRLNWAAGTLLLLGAGISGSSFVRPTVAASVEPACRITDIVPWLNDRNGLGAKPLIIATLLDRGPEILYRTPHSVVSAPYHRNAAGIWDTYRIFATRDDAESRAIVTRRGIDLLLLCPSRSERQFFGHETAGGSLYDRLIDGKVPDWLAPVPVPPGSGSEFRLFRIRS